MFRLTLITVIFSTMITVQLPSQTQSLDSLLPDIPDGWNEDELPKLYYPDNLYDYIDGGAELYISYNFDSVISMVISKEKIGEIRIEIFDMHEDRNAFGVFTHTRTDNENKFGQGSQYFTGAQFFWKSRYFVTVIANDDNEEIRSTINNIAEQIDKKITSQGREPSIVQLLPPNKLVKNGFIYFHHYIWLNSYYFLSNENIFQIDDSDDAIIAKYESNNHKYFLLLIHYDKGEKAINAKTEFKKHFMESKKDGSVIKIEDGTWIGVATKGNYFIAVFNADNKNSVRILLSDTELNIGNVTR